LSNPASRRRRKRRLLCSKKMLTSCKTLSTFGSTPHETVSFVEEEKL
jgi:hypothetical protein